MLAHSCVKQLRQTTFVLKVTMDYKRYSNPLFALLLILNALVFPVYHASAALADDPVQPMASTGEEVANALDAVMAGVSTDNAFGIKPLPYREFGSFWKSAYEELFDVPYQIDAYMLQTELNSDTTDLLRNGETVEGHDFTAEFALIVEADFDQPAITQTIRDLITARSGNMLGVVASIITNHGQIYFFGSVNQWDDSNGIRIREIVPVYELTLEEYTKYVNLNPELMAIQGGYEPGPTETTPYEDCVLDAAMQWQDQKDAAKDSNDIRKALIAGIMVAGAVACVASSAIPIIGLIGASSCLKAVLAGGALAAGASAANLFADLANADDDLDANLASCCEAYPAECDTSPR